ncbi:hypothetical protein Tco_0906903 [Tanacetum coccineum]|uniref:Uncharacterized protein n=1 Tax=Tanacetum coccineum TaxID=301880 RepID=A0ABQ5CK38_9ASTR
MGVFGGVEKIRALGANGIARGSTIEFVWIEVKGGMVRAKVVSMVEEQALDAMELLDGRKRIEFLINKLGMRSFTPETLKQLADEVDE